MNKRIYLAGRISGRNYKSVHAEFAAAKRFLLDQGFDEVINPCEIIVPGTGWTDCMLILLPYLATCNFIAILPSYQRSNGAMTEYYFSRGMENEGLMKAIIHIKMDKTNVTAREIPTMAETLKSAV